MELRFLRVCGMKEIWVILEEFFCLYFLIFLHTERQKDIKTEIHNTERQKDRKTEGQKEILEEFVRIYFLIFLHIDTLRTFSPKMP